MSVAVTAGEVLQEGGFILALGVFSGVVALLTATAFRWHLDEELPQGVALLFGTGAIALWLNTTASIGQAIGGTTDLLTLRAAGFTILAFGLGALAAESGRIVGDTVGARLRRRSAFDGTAEGVTHLLRGGKRGLRVELPADIHDIDGYDPVREDIKDQLAEETMIFPGAFTLEELHEAFSARMDSEYGIGKVDVEFTPDGEITYLAVGRGMAGIGHTLPPGTVAVAIRADPAFSASPGDAVRIWRTDPAPVQVATGELRGIINDIVTVAIDADDADALSDEGPYRLMTMPAGQRADREFAALLRRSNESAAEVTVPPESPVIGQRMPDVGVTVLAIERSDGSIAAPPSPETTVAGGDRLIVYGRPDAIRRFESTTQGTS